MQGDVECGCIDWMHKEQASTRACCEEIPTALSVVSSLICAPCREQFLAFDDSHRAHVHMPPLPYQTLGNATATTRLFGLMFNIRPTRGPQPDYQGYWACADATRHLTSNLLGIILRLQGSSSCHSERKFAPAAKSPFISAPTPCRTLSVECFKHTCRRSQTWIDSTGVQRLSPQAAARTQRDRASERLGMTSGWITGWPCHVELRGSCFPVRQLPPLPLADERCLLETCMTGVSLCILLLFVACTLSPIIPPHTLLKRCS